MKKVVINTCFGGFGLSDEAYEELIKLGIPVSNEHVRTEEPMIFKNNNMLRDFYKYYDNFTDTKREHPLLIEVVEKLGEKSWGMYANLKVVEIPDDVSYYIHDYDGTEEIHEQHNSWS
jgi:hypothetical protein